LVIHSGLEKSAVPLLQTSRFSLHSSNFSLSPARWARDHASHLPIKSILKEQTSTYSGQTELRITCLTGKLEFNLFSSPDTTIASLFTQFSSYQKVSQALTYVKEEKKDP